MNTVDVIGYEGYYKVTDDGRVISVRSGKELKPKVGRDGYLKVNLSVKGKYKTFVVHQLVYYGFNPTDTEKGDCLVIDHIDGNRQNNHLSNLRRITTRENTTRAKKNRYAVGVRYFKHSRKYGAEIQIENERFRLGNTFPTEEEASEAYQKALNDWNEHHIKPIILRKTEKFCKGCGIVKPLSEFYYIKNHGVAYYCKVCTNLRAKERYQRRKNKLG